MPKPKKIDHLLEVVRACIERGKYRDTTHALQRQKEKKIILTEIIQVLNTGRHEKAKDRFDESYDEWNYAIRGLTRDGLDMRVIVSFEGLKGLLIITAFYIEKEENGKAKD